MDHDYNSNYFSDRSYKHNRNYSNRSHSHRNYSNRNYSNRNYSNRVYVPHDNYDKGYNRPFYGNDYGCGFGRCGFAYSIAFGFIAGVALAALFFF